MIRKKDYISWSQYSLWKTSKREFWKRYELEENRSANKFFDKGKELADALEYGDEGISCDQMLTPVIALIPKLSIMEHKVECVLSNGEKTLSFLDSCSSDLQEFFEYKTGKIAWTQEKVDKHQQLLFYALSLYISSGRTTVPKSTLYWIETEQTEQGLRYTGVIESFDRTFTVEEVEDFELELINAIKEIEEYVYEETQLEDEDVDRYIEIDNAIKELEAEKDLIRLKIKVLMDTEGVSNARATNGKFSISDTKKWVYSKSLVETKNDIAKQIKIAEAQEQKDGKAKQVTTQTLRFSLNKHVD